MLLKLSLLARNHIFLDSDGDEVLLLKPRQRAEENVQTNKDNHSESEHLELLVVLQHFTGIVVEIALRLHLQQHEV